jgi:hypothetical protein
LTLPDARLESSFAVAFLVAISEKPALSSPEGLERNPKGEATDLAAFVLAVIFLSHFSAQKSRVKSETGLTNKE